MLKKMVSSLRVSNRAQSWSSLCNVKEKSANKGLSYIRHQCDHDISAPQHGSFFNQRGLLETSFLECNRTCSARGSSRPCAAVKAPGVCFKSVADQMMSA